MNFMAVKKSGKRSVFLFIHIWRTVHLQQLKGMQSFKLGQEPISIANRPAPD